MNETQYAEIIRKFQSPLLMLIYNMVHSWETARDLAQDTFVRLWDFRDRIITEKPYFTLLYRIAINLAIDHLRKKKPDRLEFIETVPQASSGNHDSDELRQIILFCARQLKPKQQAAFLLRDIEGFSIEEIGSILDMPLSNVSSNLHLARKNIRKMLETKYQLREENYYEM